MADRGDRLRDLLALHFDPDNGSAYWLERQQRLGFDVRDRIRTEDELWSLGPTPLEDLRRYPVKSFIPRVFHNELHRFVTGETAGTGGEPRATVYRDDEFQAAFVTPFLRVAKATGGRCGYIHVPDTGRNGIAAFARQFFAQIDRARASQFGLTANSIALNLNTSLSSSEQVSPNFWTDPKNGTPYYLTVQTPEYRLNSLNEIENTLLQPREAQQGYEPALFRSAYRTPRGGAAVERRNPLTVAQESVLRSRANGVSLLIGCAAGGLADLPDFLRLGFGDEFFHRVSGATAADATYLAASNRKW